MFSKAAMTKIQFSIIALITLGLLANSCSLTKPVKTGDMAYEFKQYALAVELLEKEYNNARNDQIRARKALYLANSYDMLEKYGEALQWYDKADQLYNNENSAIELAYSLKRNERYADAAKVFDEIFRNNNVFDYRREAAFCREASKQMQKEYTYKVESLSFNSQDAEYSPVYFESNFIIFSSDRDGSTGRKVYKWNNSNYSDLFVSDLKGRQVYNFDALINSEHNEGTVAFSKDFQEIFFTRCVSTENRDQHCKIFYSQRPNGFWLEPEALMFYDDRTNFAHPCLIENDSVLIFTAKPKGSNNYDLYYSVKVDKGWSEASIMPENINTAGDEKFPTSFGDTLYFSSDGHLGFGGLDVFRSILQDDGSWSDPVNMGWPVNSGADDFGFSRREGNDNENMEWTGLLSSSRNTGTATDIFSISKWIIAEEEVPADDLADRAVEDKSKTERLVYLAGQLVGNEHAMNDPNAEVIRTIALPEGLVEIKLEGSKDSLQLDDDARFINKLERGGKYFLTAKAKDYLTKQIELEVPAFDSLNSDTTINVVLDLEKVFYDTEIIISDIYYDFDKWDIRDDARPALNELVEILKLNPAFSIVLASHTDCRGEEDYNQELSQKRAESAVAYLAAQGIASERLVAKGYGESKLYIDCICQECTETEHQANRRTTFSIRRPDE